MRVLMLAPLWYPVSRDALGGIETFLFRLVAALHRHGCEVTLLASGDSSTAADLVPVVERNLYSLMVEGAAGEYVYYEQHQLQLVIELASQFDVVHSHVGPGGYVLSGVPGTRERTIHTVHTPVYGDMRWFVATRCETALVAVSEFQAGQLRMPHATGPLRSCPVVPVVPNGVDVADFTFSDRPGDGLLFVGRMEEGKGPDLAISVAREMGRPLTLAGPVVDRNYFDGRIAPCLDADIRYVGVVDHDEKVRLFGEAACTLLPFRHSESFGMVSIEAMSCGTPVVALANGAMPEIVEPGITGYLTDNPAQLADLALRAIALSRAVIRERAVTRFGIDRTARLYMDIYQQIARGDL